jgi:inosose dehydratase
VQKSDGRHNLAERQRGLVSCFSDIAARAAERGIAVSFHPNSLDTSLFVDQADYDVLERILPENVGFAPDLGHIARGGMDVLETIRRFGDRVVHMHVKDMYENGDWAPTGEGVVDIEGVFEHLSETGFTGWIAFEDESALAETDPDEATLRAGRWVQENLAAYRADA